MLFVEYACIVNNHGPLNYRVTWIMGRKKWILNT